MNPDTPSAGKRGGKSNRPGPASAESGETTTGAAPQQSTSANAATSAGASSPGADRSTANQGADFLGQIKEKAASRISEQKNRATAGLGGVADAVRQTGRQLRDQHHDTVAQVAERAADQLDRFSRHLRERDLAELVEEARQLARQQPAWFVGSSFAAGLLAARFIKSSSPERPSSDVWARGGESVYGDPNRSDFEGSNGPGETGTTSRGSY
jgi:hypothetical protein